MDDGVRTTTRRGLLRTLGVAFAAATLVAAAAGRSSADARRARVGGPSDADVELVLLHGTKADKPLLPKDFPELASPPWNAYNHYDVLSTKKLALANGKTVTEPLPDGSTLETTLLEKDKTDKYKLEIVVKDGKGAQVSKGKYSAGKGARFMPVTLPYKGGILVVSLKVM
jgi:hypothetical protein